MHFRDILTFLILMIGFALLYPLIKIGLHYTTPVYLFFYRMVFAAIFGYLILALQGIKLNLKLGCRKAIIIIVLTFFNYIFLGGLVFVAEKTEPASISVIVVYTMPIFSLFLSKAFLSEKINLYRIIGSIVGFLGLFVTFFFQSRIIVGLGLLYLFVASISWAGASVIFRREFTSKDAPVVNFYQMVIAIPIILIWAFYSGHVSNFMVVLQPISLFIELIMGGISTALSFYFYYHLIGKYGVTRISPYLFLVPITAVLLSAVLINEEITDNVYVGLSMISMSVYLVSRR